MRDPQEIGQIVSTPGTCGGKPRIAGTRIWTKLVWDWLNAGYSWEYIQTEWPYLDAADIIAAVSYELRKGRVSEHAWAMAKYAMLDYPLVITWSKEDQTFLVTSPGLDFTTHGDTQKQALKAGKQALRLYLAAKIDQEGT